MSETEEVAAHDSRLAELERQMLAAIMAGPGAGGETTAWAESTLAPSASMSGVARLAVYQGAYWARLLGCLREDFPVLERAVGEEAFRAFAVEYLRAYPPRSYTLGRLADAWVAHLRASCPDGPDEHWPRFVVELAELEWTIQQVFDGPGDEEAPAWNPQELAGLTVDAWLGTRLATDRSLRFLDFHYAVNDYFTTVRASSPTGGWVEPDLVPGAHPLALARREYVVWRFPLALGERSLLAALRDGRTVGEALSELAAPPAPEELRRWFARWTANGLLRGRA